MSVVKQEIEGKEFKIMVPEIDLKGFFLYDSNSLSDVQSIFPSGDGIFLDLGCSTLEIVILAALKGWSGYGIEFAKNEFDAGVKTAQFAHEDHGVEVTIAHGSFYPEGYGVIPSSESYGPQSRYYLDQLDGQRPYEALGITFASVDFFYHFECTPKGELFRLFSQQAKPGAQLLLRTSTSREIPSYENIRLREQPKERFYLFEHL